MEAWIPKEILPVLLRTGVVIFSTLGVVYMLGRLLFPKMGDQGKNITAFLALIIISFGVTLVFDHEHLIDGECTRIEKLRYLVDSMLYATSSAVFYVIIGWKFYSRADRWLDKTFAEDKKPRGRKKK